MKRRGFKQWECTSDFIEDRVRKELFKRDLAVKIYK
jgi:hypothetical protein